MQRRAGEDIERLRRSMAMLSPGQPAGMTREEAKELLGELHATAGELARLQRGLRALLEGDDLA